MTIAMTAIGASAQYNPTINVDGSYKPEIIIQDRINTYPQRERLGILDSRLEFDTEGVITDFTPQGVPMPATGWNIDREPYPWRGYVDLGLGSWLDARLNAGYRWTQSSKTISGIYLRHNSTSLWEPFEYSDTRRQLYDETIGVYVRNKTNAGILDAHLRYNLAYFNYYGAVEVTDATQSGAGKEEETKRPTQTLNRLGADIIWNGHSGDRLVYHAGADVRYTGFRSFLTDAKEYIKGNRETIIMPKAGIRYSLSKISSIGINLSGDAVLYAGEELPEALKAAYPMPGNYGRVRILPYFRAIGDNYEFKAGPDIDLVLNNGPIFRIAPEFLLSYHTRGLAMALEATGGTELNTLDRETAISFYADPRIRDPRPMYKPVEAWLKFKFGPFAGFQAKIEGGFKYIIDQRTGGWYQNDISSVINGFSYLPYPDPQRFDTYGFSVGIILGYKYGRWIELAASGHYQPQDKKKSWFNGWDLPEVTAYIGVSSNPWKALRLGVDWTLRANRRPLTFIYGKDYPTEGLTLVNGHLSNLSDLDFHASYGILKNLTVTLDLKNLLNRSQELLPSLPLPGISAMGGITMQF